MRVDGNQGGAPNYEPNTLNGPVEDPSKKWSPTPVSGVTGRHVHNHPNDYYEQPRVLYRKVFSETDRDHLTSNLAGALSGVRRDVSAFF